MALSFVNIIVAQIWLIGTIFGLLMEIYFLWKDIARCPDVASTLPHERTKLGSALSEFTVALVRVHTFCKAELEAERNTKKALNSERISGEK